MEHILAQFDELVQHCINKGMGGDERFEFMARCLRLNIINKGNDIQQMADLFAKHIDAFGENNSIPNWVGTDYSKR